ncbi:MAG: hypothetical protein OEM29_09335 [Thermoplasmata archaeon]|nr:hypothetical protein [Thermoplasmata archaeon]
MRRLIFASLVASTLVLMSMLSVPAVAKPCCGEALKCTIELELDLEPAEGEPDWNGAIGGDIEGIYQLWERWDEMFFTGPENNTTEHYFENFVIQAEDNRIEGIDQGVFNLGNLKFHYTGSVTGAEGDWDYLDGWLLHGQGVVKISETGVTATGTMTLVPP